MKLGKNIYRYRTQRNMSQGDLASVLEVSRQSVSKWENSSATPDLDKLLKMAEIFEISLDTLVGNQPVPENPQKPELAAAEAKPAPKPEPVAEEKALSRETGITVMELPVQKILGMVLIFLGALAVILGLALPSLGSSGLLVVVGLCGSLCGVCCLCLPYPQLFCGWCVLGAQLVGTFALTPQWEKEEFLLFLAGLGLLAMLSWTSWAQCSGKVRIPGWLLVTAGVCIAALVVLFIINWIPPVFETVDSQVPYYSDSGSQLP